MYKTTYDIYEIFLYVNEKNALQKFAANMLKCLTNEPSHLNIEYRACKYFYYHCIFFFYINFVCVYRTAIYIPIERMVWMMIPHLTAIRS